MKNNNRALALQWWREMSAEQQSAVVVKHEFDPDMVNAIGASSSMVQRIFENEINK